MQDKDSNPSGSELYRQKLILWFALISSIGMYFVVIRMVPSGAGEENLSLVNWLLMLAIALIAVSFLVKNRLTGRSEPGENNTDIVTPAQLIPLVLCESAALLGVVVHFVAGSPIAPYFLLLGLFGLVLQYPKRED